MSGTISLSLSQQFDNVTREFLDGGRLYFYAPGTTTPQNAFRDGGLVSPFPNPLTLESDGRVPNLWFADGAIRVRCTNAPGVLQFDYDNLQVFGASGGGGGGVDTTDPNSIAVTGDIKWRPQTTAIPGWVRANSRTIGSVSSGASERAAADCEALFNFLWNNFVDFICPVSGGRGGTAAADWTANKQIGLLDLRGRALFGSDSMGGSLAGRITAPVIQVGDAVTAGSSGGADRVPLATNELPIITPAGTVAITDPGHAHTLNVSMRGLNIGSSFSGWVQIPGQPHSAIPGNPDANNPGVVAALTGISASFTGTPFGGNQSHNNMSPFMLGSFFIRL